VVSRPHLALVPADGLGRRLRAPLARALVVLALVVALAGIGYAAARFTSLFALEEIEVTGASPRIKTAVRETGAAFLGTSLVALDQDELRDRLQALPSVEAVRFDRAFPHTLRIVVVPERPLAVLRDGRGSWLVSERGRVIRSVDPETKRAVVWIAPADLEPGELVGEENARLALEGLRRLPATFPGRVEYARATDGAITFELADGAEVRLGTADSLALKLAVATRILRGMNAAERAGLGYLDVSVPERAVAGPQV
jgi:cell division protein FtsQ